MIKSIIVDDELMAREILLALCEQHEAIEVVATLPNAIEAIKFLNKESVDLILLDIHMPDFTGFDFIQSLKNPPRVVMTTSDTNFALTAFEYDCIVDYLVKPITFERFSKAIQKVETLGELTPVDQSVPSKTSKDTIGKELYVNIDRRLIKINFESIYLIEAKGDYILIKTDDKNYTVHSTLKKIEEKLPDHSFLKIHRSYIINIKRIIDIEDNSVLIERDVIPISRANRPELMKRLNLL